MSDVAVGTIRPHRLLHSLFSGGGPAGYADIALLENLIRLTENAAHEYMNGKAAVLRFWSEERENTIDIGSAFQASTHFETCLTDTQRAINHITVARKRQNVLSRSRCMLPPNLSIYKRGLRDCIREIRSAIQHTENRILNGKISAGEPFAALATGDETPTADNNTLKIINRIELGPHRVEFATLAKAIEELRTCAEILVDAEYGPPGP